MSTRRATVASCVVLSLAVSVLALFAGIAGQASADAAWPVATHLQVTAPPKVDLGETVQIVARLTDPAGLPIQGAEVTFQSAATWGTTAQGATTIGTARTDGQGDAVLMIPFRQTGDLPVTAVFAGDVRHLPSTESATVSVSGTEQQVQPSVGIRIPGVGIWVLGLVLAIIWGTYLLVGSRAIRISGAGDDSDETAVATAASPAARDGEPAPNSRRDFLTRAFPAGVEAGIALLGGGLLTVLARSPKTHTNQAEDVPAGYDRTPVAYVGHDTPHTPIPPILTNEVSFSNDVLPILTSRAGPHVMFPVNSPPPGGMRLDTYEHLKMMSPGEGVEVIVPGKPEESLLMQVLVDPGKRMPPIGTPLPENELQIVASWIAQGAKNN